MFLFGIFLIYFVTNFDLSWAGVPYKDLKPKIFDSKSTDYETELYNAISTFKSENAGWEKKAAAAVPYVGKALPFLMDYSGLLKDGSDWKRTVASSINDVNDQKSLDEEIKRMQAAVDSIHSSITSAANLDLNMVNWSVRSWLDYLLNIFAAHKSLLKKYPLVGAPALIDLARFMATLNSNITNGISCKMRNILLEYRKRTVDARLDKIASEWTIKKTKLETARGTNYDIPLIRSRVMSLDYNENGYNSNNELPCEKYAKSKSIPYSTYALKDKFDDEYNYGVFQQEFQGYKDSNLYPQYVFADEFNSFDANYNHLTPAMQCAVDYFSFIRHKVEEMFPVQLFSNFCGTDDSQKPTGKGYLTLKIKHGSFVIENDGTEMEDDGNQPYVDVYVNGNNDYTSPAVSSCYQCNMDKTYESGLINKNSKIKIEVWDKDGGKNPGWKDLWNKDDKIIDGNDVQGTVDDFLKKGMFFLRNHQDPKSELYNYLETSSFWKDDYELKPIANEFLRQNGR